MKTYIKWDLPLNHYNLPFNKVMEWPVSETLDLHGILME